MFLCYFIMLRVYQLLFSVLWWQRVSQISFYEGTSTICVSAHEWDCRLCKYFYLKWRYGIDSAERNSLASAVMRKRLPSSRNTCTYFLLLYLKKFWYDNIKCLRALTKYIYICVYIIKLLNYFMSQWFKIIF